ncbi:MAG TPA: TetR/AcrR family transcriptional regulator [bacterium]|nr:TetR/AcrR family transcriptional regulator [bacterium]
MAEPDIKERILESAMERVLRYGFKKTTMDEIAADAGISKGALYLHFKNKDEIVLEVATRNVRRVLSLVEHNLKTEKPVPERLSNMYLEWLELILKNPVVSFGIKSVALELKAENREKLYEKLSEFVLEALVPVINEGIENNEIKSDVDPVELASLYMIQMRHAVYISNFFPEFDWRGSWRSMWGMICNGIVPEHEKRKNS